MWEALSVHRDMALDPRYFLSGVIPLLFGAIGVLHALCVNDAEARGLFPPKAFADLANGFFLSTAPGGSAYHSHALAIGNSNSRSGYGRAGHLGSCATDNRS